MPTFSGTKLGYGTRSWCTWILNVTTHSNPLSRVWVNTTVGKIKDEQAIVMPLQQQ